MALTWDNVKKRFTGNIPDTPAGTTPPPASGWTDVGGGVVHFTGRIDLPGQVTGALSVGQGIIDLTPVGGGVSVFMAKSGMSGGGNRVVMGQLPTSDPGHPGEVWNDAGTLKVSA